MSFVFELLQAYFVTLFNTLYEMFRRCAAGDSITIYLLASQVLLSVMALRVKKELDAIKKPSNPDST